MIFLFSSCIVFIAISYWAPKLLSKSEIYATALFSIVLGYTTDTLFDLKYHFYGYIEHGVQFAGYLPILVLFPTAGVMYINFFPYALNFLYKSIYIVCWSIFCLVFEFLSVKEGYFYHNGWKYWHSAITYPILLLLLLGHLKLFRNFMAK